MNIIDLRLVREFLHKIASSLSFLESKFALNNFPVTVTNQVGISYMPTVTIQTTQKILVENMNVDVWSANSHFINIERRISEV